MKFKRTEFVQVLHRAIGKDFKSKLYWRNALYIVYDNGHIVRYTDGTTETLGPHQRIRRAELKEYL